MVERGGGGGGGGGGKTCQVESKRKEAQINFTLLHQT